MKISFIPLLNLRLNCACSSILIVGDVYILLGYTILSFYWIIKDCDRINE